MVLDVVSLEALDNFNKSAPPCAGVVLLTKRSLKMDRDSYSSQDIFSFCLIPFWKALEVVQMHKSAKSKAIAYVLLLPGRDHF